MVIQVCVGSSCHLKGSSEIAALFQKTLKERGLEDRVALVGSLCIGQCGRTGVTVQIDDQVHAGITPENFQSFFLEHVLSPLENERK